MTGARGEPGENEPVNSEFHHDDDASSINVGQEKTPPVILTKRQKFKRHCGRFKWWYLIGVIILLAILLPILFEVIIPALVQDIVNDQTLPIYSGAIVALSPTQLSISLNTSMDTPLSARIDPLDLHLYNRGTEPYTPFVTLHLPEQRVHHTTHVVVTNQTVTIEDEEEVIKWFHSVFDNADTFLSVRGSPRVHLGALNYHPHLDLELKIPALNHLHGFDITEMNFMMEPDENGKNMRGLLNLPNSGALALGLGNVTFGLVSGDVQLGTINVYDTYLDHGNNSRVFDGNLYFNELVPNINAILDAQRDYLGQGFIQINATGEAAVVNGVHIPYLERVFRTKKLTVNLPILTLLGDVLNSLLESDQDSLLEAFGDTFGNSTLLEHIMDHWDGYTNNTNLERPSKKRSAPKMSLMLNMFRLGMRAKK
ncbi:hypothetical protein B0I35DRAFT_390182 [Stachybotrys elegans]|uniref:Uncharacterized protein n=1 Tax=Stachybotrys elegans TaxID=80388 RepID=A0A8K0SW69_9HYPO|nr:hypothetical protein B0I35DRAFT_390182 [Stachybotrys elegans]